MNVETLDLPFPDSENMYMNINLSIERNYNDVTLQELYDIRTTLQFIYDRIDEELMIIDNFIKFKNEDVDKLLYRH